MHSPVLARHQEVGGLLMLRIFVEDHRLGKIYYDPSDRSGVQRGRILSAREGRFHSRVLPGLWQEPLQTARTCVGVSCTPDLPLVPLTDLVFFRSFWRKASLRLALPPAWNNPAR